VGQLRVRVRAAGLNRADLVQRRGHYPPPPGAPADIPGLEYAGVVDAVGGGVEGWRVGDRVMGLVGGGACAEMVLAEASEALRIPDTLSYLEAASIPEAFITAHDALFTLLALRSGEDLLIHAVGSGVGVAALQLARTVGARTFGTSRSAWKLERAREFGLDVAIDVTQARFDEVVLEHTGARGVDAILDLVGGGYLEGNMRALAVRGRMAVVGLVAGSRAELDLGVLLRKRLTLIGTAMRGRSAEEKAAAAAAFRTDALPLFPSGTLRPVLDRVFPAHEVRAAHEYVESNRNFGKVVLEWGGE
jgi:putative PIG3 family NAD(P)H quinone oxidoreductase